MKESPLTFSIRPPANILKGALRNSQARGSWHSRRASGLADSAALAKVVSSAVRLGLLFFMVVLCCRLILAGPESPIPLPDHISPTSTWTKSAALRVMKYGGRGKGSRVPLDSRLRGDDRLWGVQRGEAPLRFRFLPPRVGGRGLMMRPQPCAVLIARSPPQADDAAIPGRGGVISNGRGDCRAFSSLGSENGSQQ